MSKVSLQLNKSLQRYTPWLRPGLLADTCSLDSSRNHSVVFPALTVFAPLLPISSCRSSVTSSDAVLRCPGNRHQGNQPRRRVTSSCVYGGQEGAGSSEREVGAD